jgi:hypothetical protein
MRGPNFADYATESASENEILFSFGGGFSADQRTKNNGHL